MQDPTNLHPGAAEATAGPEDQGAGMLPFLSLFLLLLAFFIVLGTLTRFESVRTRAALGSLEAAFRGPETGRSRLPAAPSGALSPAAAIEAELREVLAAGLPLAEAEMSRDDVVVMLALGAGEVFVLRQAELRGDRAATLDRLSRIALTPPPGTRVAIEVRIESPNFEPETRRLAALRAGALARALVARGIGPDGVSAGLDEGPGGHVRFRFRILPPGEAGR